MKKQNRMSITANVMMTFTIVIIFMLIMGLLSIFFAYRIYSNGNSIYYNQFSALNALRDIDTAIVETDNNLTIALNGSEQEALDAKADIDLARQNISESIERYNGLKLSEAEDNRFRQLCLSIDAYYKEVDAVFEALYSGNAAEAESISESRLSSVRANVNEMIDAAIDLSDRSAAEDNESNRKAFRSVILIIFISIITVIIAVFIAAVRLSRYIKSRLSEIKQYADRISEYDVTTDIENVGNDEFGQAVGSLNDAQFMIRGMLTRITEHIKSISEFGEDVFITVRNIEKEMDETVEILDDAFSEINEIEDDIKSNIPADERGVSGLEQSFGRLEEVRDNLKYIKDNIIKMHVLIEQIDVTLNYQNEIMRRNRDQIDKFKV